MLPKVDFGEATRAEATEKSIATKLLSYKIGTLYHTHYPP
jgi:hypothetical protein